MQRLIIDVVWLDVMIHLILIACT